MGWRINNCDEAYKFFESTKNNGLYIVGCGELGDYLGQFLIKSGIKWDGYIDQNVRGIINDRVIYEYGSNELKGNAFFLISSPKFENSIRECLLNNGVDEGRIYTFFDRDIIYDIYEKFSPLMKKLREGAYKLCSYGEKDSNKTYAILQNSEPYEGIFSNLFFVLEMLPFIERNGFIPVIDKRHYPFFLGQNREHWGKENGWEYYFDQYGGITLDYVYEGCKNVRIYNTVESWNLKYVAKEISCKNDGIENIKEWHRLLEKYVHINSKIQSRIDKEYRSILSNKGNVLGVIVRESFYAHIRDGLKNTKIPFQAGVEEIICFTKEKKKEWGMSVVYLMCETDSTINEFRKVFGEELLVYPRKRRDNCNENIPFSNTFHENELGVDVEEKTMDYIVETILASMCNALICSRNGGSYAAMLFNGGEYSHIYVYDGEGYQG